MFWSFGERRDWYEKATTLYFKYLSVLVVFAVLFVLIYFQIKTIVLDNLIKVNGKLTVITNGNLDVTVDVCSNEEFASLSDDINAIVNTLKRFRSQFNTLLADESRNTEISSLIAYMNSGKENRRYVGRDNTFTVKVLYRLGFSWPLTGESYIKRAVKALSTLGFFDGEDNE